MDGHHLSNFLLASSVSMCIYIPDGNPVNYVLKISGPKCLFTLHNLSFHLNVTGLYFLCLNTQNLSSLNDLLCYLLTVICFPIPYLNF